MELLSMLLGADNLRKLAVMAGLVLIGFGFLYPLQRNLELKDKQIKLTEEMRIDSVELINIQKEVDILNITIADHTAKVKCYAHEKDSLMAGTLDENSKFKINFLQTEITTLYASDDSSLKETKTGLNKIETAKIRAQSLQKEIDNLESFIGWYRWFCYIFCAGGIILLCIGLRKWGKSQKESDELVKVEVQIKKEELTKLQRENTPGP